MKKVALLIAAAAFATSALAKDIKLTGEYGCDSPETQQSRVVLLQNIMSNEPHYVAQRKEMTDSLLNISKYMCRPLNGSFKITKTQGPYSQVQTPDGLLWVMN